MKTIWVTGAHGFLGRNLSLTLSKKGGFRVIGIGRGKWTPEETMPWGLERWVESDVTLSSLSELGSETVMPDVIFHAAGSGSVSPSFANPYLDYERTVSTTVAVLEFVRTRCPATRVIYPSSAAVYGSMGEGPIYEDVPLQPVSPYGMHKDIVELLCHSYATHFNVRVSLVRLFSLYGNGLTKQLLWDLCHKFEKGEREVMLYGTGNEVRDWIHIDDAVSLMIIAMDRATAKAPTVNGGSGVGTTVKEVALEIRKCFDNTSEVKFNGVARKGDPLFYEADIRRARAWGWSPACFWKSGMADYVRWFKQRRGSP